jgi:hypothetical protein
MSEYLEQVVRASGGFGAPAGLLDKDKIEAPKGYHYMPDGELMKDSEHEAAALEKDSDDPCWSGYVQVGMKNKNGRQVPNCVPSSASIDEIVFSINSEFGETRQVSIKNAYAVARQACDKYSYLGDTEELTSAILWEVYSYVEYATEGVSEDMEEMSKYSDLLPEGHPKTDAPLTASIAWLSGDLSLTESSKDALFQAFSTSEHHLQSLHAATRLKALIASGEISEATLALMRDLAIKAV